MSVGAITEVRATRLSAEVAVSRAGRHSSVILAVIYFHPLKRATVKATKRLTYRGLAFQPGESRECLHSGDVCIGTRMVGHSTQCVRFKSTLARLDWIVTCFIDLRLELGRV